MNSGFYDKLVELLSCSFSVERLRDAISGLICDVQYLSLLCENCRLPQKFHDLPGYRQDLT